MHLQRPKDAEAGVIVSVNSDERQRKSINRHTFIRKVHALLPGSSKWQAPAAVLNAVYYECQVCPLQLLDSLFSDICNRKLTLMSCGKLDTSDCICIDAGVVTLSLMKKTYQRAGLDGRPSKAMQGKWLVVLDFTAPGFSGSKNMHRMRKCFSALAEKIDVRCSYDGGRPCPVALEHVFGPSKNLDIHTRSLKASSPTSLKEPLESWQRRDEDHVFHELQEDVHTHLTLLCQGYETGTDQDPYISVYAGPEPSTVEEKSITTVTGFFTPTLVQQINDAIQSSTISSWGFVQMVGFEDAAVAWRGTEHGKLLGGENVVSVLHCVQDEHTQTIMWEVVAQCDTYT